jgi:hypothetical protein
VLGPLPGRDPPGSRLRWSAAERSRLVSSHTVIGGNAVHRKPVDDRWEDRPEHPDGGRGGSEQWLEAAGSRGWPRSVSWGF